MLKTSVKTPMRILLAGSVGMAVALASLPGFATSAAAPISIRIFVGLGTGAEDGQRTQEDALARQWNDANPDIQIRFEYNDYATARDLLLSQVAGNNAPDIVGPVGIGGLNSTGDLWADLSHNINADQSTLKLADFDPATLKLYQLNGKNIAVPLGIYPSFMFINTDLFKQAGQPLPPTDYNNGNPMYQGKLWDMAAVRDLAIKLTQDKNGHFGNQAAFDPSNIQVYGFADIAVDMRGFAQLFSPGHAGVAPDGKTAIFNGPTYIQAMQWLHNAIYKDHFYPDNAAQQSLNSGGTTVFPSGRVAMNYGHTWALGDLTAVKFHWVAAVTPVAPNGKLTARINADTFAILDKGKNKDAAWKVLKWLTSSQIAAQACAIYGCLPARISGRTDWEKQIKAPFPALDLNIVYGAIKYLDIPNSEAPMPHYNQAVDTFTRFFTALNSTPDMDVKAELDKLNVQEQAIFDGSTPATAAAATP